MDRLSKLGTIGLERSQVDPRIARLREDGIVEYDLERRANFPGLVRRTGRRGITG